MATTTEVVVGVPQTGASAPPSIDWGAVLGGAFVASALSFVLLSFGSSAGIASVSPWSYNNASAKTLGIIAVAWVLVSMIGSFLAGGYVAGRMRKPGYETTVGERQLRDGMHGLVVWGLGMVIGAIIAALAVTSAIRGAANVATSAAATASAAAAGAGATLAANTPADQVRDWVDSMMRSTPQAGQSTQAGRTEDDRAEVGRILSRSWTSGDVSQDDRNYLAQLIAARAGVPEDEAKKRVDTAVQQVKEAVTATKDAADKARKSAAILAFLLGAASICAAGAAYWAAGAGGEQRDEAFRPFG
ncbi:MAG: hypothetical protein J0H17_05680 [Rhizobiales bacterium]|nr:hypothetical protein [Hyphomicrobiales bacterium]